MRYVSFYLFAIYIFVIPFLLSIFFIYFILQYRIKSFWFSGLKDAKFDLIVSNPPYIEENDEHLKALSFEPIGALTSGQDGLDDIRLIVRESRQFLNNDGVLLLEHGYNQGKRVRDILTENGFSEVNTLKDLGENERVTYGVFRK